MDLDDTATIQLCLAPLHLYALCTAPGQRSGPRAEWRLLCTLEKDLVGRDPLSDTLVDALKSNLHKFHTLHCQRHGQARPDELLAELAAVRQRLDGIGAGGRGAQGYLRTLEAFAEKLAASAAPAASLHRDALFTLLR